jgi:PAS domain S-box-containing protein
VGWPKLVPRSAATPRFKAIFTNTYFVHIVVVFLGYYIAGVLGQATTSLRSGNLGPVWPAYGVAVAAVLAYGSRIWPGVAASAFLVALQSPVPAFTAMGQAAGATFAAVAAGFALRRVPGFDPTLPRLRDALAFILLGAFGSALISASIGTASLHASRLDVYTGLFAAGLIYWLGDATGALLVTPLLFTLRPLLGIRSPGRIAELVMLVVSLVAVSLVVMSDLPFYPMLAFAVQPVVMWGSIRFGVGGAALSVFIVATIATLRTALGSGPFSWQDPFASAALLDVLFTTLAVSGLTLAAVVAERERSEEERETLARARSAADARLRLAAVVESSNDAIVSTTLDCIIENWNAAAHRMFGFTEAEAVGQTTAIFAPDGLRNEEARILARLRTGKTIQSFETIRLTKDGKRLNVSMAVSPIRDANGGVRGAAMIIRDISTQKHAEEAISSVSRRLIEAQEHERSRIARELHDDIGQRLSLLAVNIESLTEGPLGRPRLEAATMALFRQASEIGASIQALSHELHSPRLTLLGLTAAMRHFCEEFAHQQKVAIDFESRDVPDQLPSTISLTLFRILQEALHNAAKHSGASQFEARVWRTPIEIHLTVADQGTGFDVTSARLGRGIGLVSMEERVKLVNGGLSIESQPHGGTTIHAWVRL